MYPEKKPEADLKLKYRKVLEVSLVISLFFLILIFQFFPSFETNQDIAKAADIEIFVQDIPQTEQIKNAPPPSRPSIPIPSESEDIPDDLTIESTELDLSELPPPPPPPADDIEGSYVFIPFDEPPTPQGGYPAILKNLRYPEIARKAGMEGSVVVGVLIDKTGKPLRTQILKGSGTQVGFEKAAEEAVMATKWNPAKQRDMAIKVWVSIPVRFQLRNAENM